MNTKDDHYFLNRVASRKENKPPYSSSLLAISLFMLGVCPASADFNGSDTLASGKTNWVQTVLGGAQDPSQNGRLEYIVNPATGRDQIGLTWNINEGSYTKDWSVQVGVHLDMLSLPTNSFINLNLAISDAANKTNSLFVSIDRYHTSGSNPSYVSSFKSSMMTSGITTTMPNSATDGTIQITFDSLAKTLAAWWNTGSGWNLLNTISINGGSDDWGMNDSSLFDVWLVGSSASMGNGVGPSVASGQAFFSNFQATTALDTQPPFRLEITNALELRVFGSNGPVRIEYATNLNEPISSSRWFNLTALQLTNSPMIYADESASNSTQRFYRAVR